MERAAAHERAHKLPVFIHAHDEQWSFEIVAFRYGDFGSKLGGAIFGPRRSVAVWVCVHGA